MWALGRSQTVILTKINGRTGTNRSQNVFSTTTGSGVNCLLANPPVRLLLGMATTGFSPEIEFRVWVGPKIRSRGKALGRFCFATSSRMSAWEVHDWLFSRGAALGFVGPKTPPRGKASGQLFLGSISCGGLVVSRGDFLCDVPLLSTGGGILLMIYCRVFWLRCALMPAGPFGRLATRRRG